MSFEFSYNNISELSLLAYGCIEFINCARYERSLGLLARKVKHLYKNEINTSQIKNIATIGFDNIEKMKYRTPFMNLLMVIDKKSMTDFFDKNK